MISYRMAGTVQDHEVSISYSPFWNVSPRENFLIFPEPVRGQSSTQAQNIGEAKVFPE
jgi:hypothetical protein